MSVGPPLLASAPSSGSATVANPQVVSESMLLLPLSIVEMQSPPVLFAMIELIEENTSPPLSLTPPPSPTDAVLPTMVTLTIAR